MTVRYYDKTSDTVKTLTSVTKIEPIVNGSKMSLEHATEPVVISTFNLIEVV